MKKKLILNLIVATFLGITMIGCSNRTNVQEEKLYTEIKTLQENNNELKDKYSGLDKKYKTLESKVKDQVAIIEMFKENKENDKYELIPAYTANVETYKQEIGFYMIMPKDKTLIQKLNLIAGELSSYYFNNLPIEVTKVEEVEGKKIVVVNIKESKDNEGIKDVALMKSPTWATGFLQGSAGGITTEDRLIETFLQRDYKGEWIDGVKFLYHEKTIEFEHVPNLEKVNYR
ncbi:hypothetical protein GCM10008905_29580 [Clostridium malenominatum]|uniref:Lipoprotein n=1 Tax=Clostridium malenominatum TaxID=1539 RepID=A0ABP3UFK1_9CLOT